MPASLPPLLVSAHVRYCSALLGLGGAVLPEEALSADAHRASLVYFAAASLDILGAVPSLPAASRAATIHWLLSVPLYSFTKDYGANSELSGYARENLHPSLPPSPAMIYASLATLAILGEDAALAHVDASSVRAVLRATQCTDGGVRAAVGAEADVRFVYSAAAARALLDASGDFSSGHCSSHDLDVAAASQYIARCQTYEGGFALTPGSEAHGGSTYCALAALALFASDKRGTGNAVAAATLHAAAPAAHRWLCARQLSAAAGGGMSGRANKPADACYAFWVGAALSLLATPSCGGFPASAAAAPPLHAALLACQHARPGGFSREPDAEPDPLHTHYALAGLALSGLPGLRAVDPLLGITRAAAQRLAGIAFKG